MSKLIFARALTGFPSAPPNVRLTFRTVILDFLCSMLRRFQMSSGTRHGCCGSRQRGSRFAPGKELALKERQQEAEQKRGNADRDDAGINALEIQNLASRFD